MLSRFDADYSDPALNIDPYIDEVFGELKSGFLELPRGDGFVEYQTFQAGYEVLKRATQGFAHMNPAAVLDAVREAPIVFVVLRSMLGFTPSEWADAATERSGVPIDQGTARTLDRSVRLTPLTPMRARAELMANRIRALVETACAMLSEGADPETDRGLRIHRLDKVDTSAGLNSIRHIAELGVPYPVLLYERFLGRPFAGHRDSVSEHVGAIVEDAVEAVLSNAGISARKTKRAERIPGFDQAPDFIVPDEFNPAVVIEAKLTEDDGTARDKVARVQRLRTLRDENGLDYDVVACIAGRGFKVRRNDMRRLLVATEGKVFTLASMDQLVPMTRLREFVTKPL